jgi:hypothetical protein
MPSHPKQRKPQLDKRKFKRHAGGPLKRNHKSAKEWEVVVGPSIDSLPAHQLPTVRTILQRYRALRIIKLNDNFSKLADVITSEIEVIWKKAGIPTRDHHNCVKAVLGNIEMFKNCHNPGELSRKLTRSLDSLLDLKPKLRGRVSEEAQLDHLKSLIKQQTQNWQADYAFYLDQYSGARRQHLGPADEVLHRKEKAKEERELKRARFYEQQSASTLQARY